MQHEETEECVFSSFGALFHKAVELTGVNSVAVTIPYMCLLFALGQYNAFAAVVYVLL